MNLRRTLATAVVAAVTAPALVLSAGSAALADTQPTTRTQQRPTYEELRKAAADADRAYKDAVAAEKAGQKKVDDTMDALDKGSHPLGAALLAANKAAKAAAEEKTAADQAVTDARAKLDAAEDEAAKAEARTSLEAAEAAAGTAAKKKEDADAARKDAAKAVGDARVAVFRELSKLQWAKGEALKDKEAADKALATAKECVRVPGLTVLANGLPSKVVTGSTVDFSFTVANGTDRTLDVEPLVFFRLESTHENQHFMKVEWSDGAGWKELSQQGSSHLPAIKNMRPGARTDVKMRMSITAGGPAKTGFSLFAGDASDPYNPCVLGPMKRYNFEVLPAGSKPGTVDEAKPGKVADKDRPGPKAQGGDSGKPVPATDDHATATPVPTATATDGNLASTGSSSALPQIALAGGAAVVLGAGAVFAVRRRGAKKAG
ncbi:LAETG motif-containing sortase-dependent surface protein [Streptomyces sp. NPDC003077]|uniref:LAETG motif-containing sortase-dependent surface protein n=1 Tax=Streptomyces sp. NPDC003077 TaxID=3154443 RepID=UPI00339E2360